MKNTTTLLHYCHKSFFCYLLIAAVTVFIPKISFATVFTIDISLTGAQEVPSNSSTGLGYLTGTYDDATNTLSFNLAFTGLGSPTTAAHFHGPAEAGVNAGVQIGLTTFPMGVTTGSYSNTFVLTDAQEAQLLCGLWYINIHTPEFPGGEIRGQLDEASSSSFDLSLTGAKENPPNDSTALGNFTGTYDETTNTLSFNLVFTGLGSPTTAAHLHGPAPAGVNAAVQIGFAGFPAGVMNGSYTNTYVLTDPQEADLLAGLWYVNVHTTTFPGGEIRAQLVEEGTLDCNDSNPCTADECLEAGCTFTDITPSVDAGSDRIVFPAFVPSSCATLTAAVSGGTPDFTYSWSNGATSASITVCPTVNTSYCVTVTDANGCQDSDCVSVCVRNISCGSKKVNVCHRSGNGKFNTLCISTNAVAAHLAHGDQLGQCGLAPCAAFKTSDGVEGTITNGIESIQAYPNPFSDKLTIAFTLANDSHVKLEVFSMTGQWLSTVFDGDVNAAGQHTFEYNSATGCNCMVIYRLLTEQGAYYGKAVMVR